VNLWDMKEQPTTGVKEKQKAFKGLSLYWVRQSSVKLRMYRRVIINLV